MDIQLECWDYYALARPSARSAFSLSQANNTVYHIQYTQDKFHSFNKNTWRHSSS